MLNEKEWGTQLGEKEIGAEGLEVLTNEESRALFASCGYTFPEIRITDAVPVDKTSEAR